MDALAETGMKFQAVGVNQNAPWSEVCEVRPRKQSAPRIIDLVLLLGLRQPGLANRPDRA